MLKSQLCSHSGLEAAVFVKPNPFLLSNSKPLLPTRWECGGQRGRQNPKPHHLRLAARPALIKASSVASSTEKTVSVKALVTVKRILGSGLYLERGLDDIADLFGKSLRLELICADLDPGPSPLFHFFLTSNLITPAFPLFLIQHLHEICLNFTIPS